MFCPFTEDVLVTKGHVLAAVLLQLYELFPDMLYVHS